MITLLRKKTSVMATYVLLAVVSMFIVIPLAFMLINSVKTPNELNLQPISLPETIQWSNYAAAWEKANIFSHAGNSILVTLCSVTFIVGFGSLASYALTRMGFRWLSAAIFTFFLTGLILPSSAGLIPLFIQLREMHLFDTKLGLMLIYTAQGLPVTVFLFVKFFQSLPRELEEAATVDGLGHMGIFTRIVLPIVLPVAVTAVIINALTVWNDFFNAMVYTSDPSNKTLPLGLVAFKGQFSTDWGQLFAASTLIALPILLLYMFLQRYMIDGLTAGSVKG